MATVVEVSATWVDFRVPDDVPRRPWADGALPVSPTVLAPNGSMGGSVHVWVAGGALTAIEQGWVTEEAPEDWPMVHQIVWPLR